MLISDLLTFSQSKAIENAILITGDADLTPGVVSAQALGLRVHLISIGPAASTSPYLAAEVDKKVVWDPSVVASFAKPAAPEPASVCTPTTSAMQPAQDEASIISARETETLPLHAKASLATPLAGGPRAVAEIEPSSSNLVADAAAIGQQTSLAAPTVSIPSVRTPILIAPGKPATWETAATGEAPSNPTEPKPVLHALTAVDFTTIAGQAHAKIVAGQNSGMLATASGASQPLPNIIDRAVLRTGAAYAGRMLTEPEKRQLRVAFKSLL
jgi:hypothetical protein